MGVVATSTGPKISGYEVTEKIGEGPVGEVFRATELSLDREVAIKVLRPELASRSGVADRFLMQARELAGLNHPNIATVYTLFYEGPVVLVVTEYVEGWPITATSRRAGGSKARHVLPLFLQALDGVGFAHFSGVLHLGIKPSNLMVTPAGTVKVMDFGASRCIGPGEELRNDPYLPPEPRRGAETDPRSDVYSLGVLLYEMLAGHAPFDLDRARQNPLPALSDAAPDVPGTLGKVVMRALEATPERRFVSINQFCSSLEATLPDKIALGNPIGRGELILAEPIDPVLRGAGESEWLDDNPEESTQVLDEHSSPWRGRRRKRATSFALGLAFFGLVALAALGLQLVTRSPQEVPAQEAADRSVAPPPAATAPWAQLAPEPPDAPREVKPDDTASSTTRRAPKAVTQTRSEPVAEEPESEEWVIRRR